MIPCQVDNYLTFHGGDPELNIPTMRHTSMSLRRLMQSLTDQVKPFQLRFMVMCVLVLNFIFEMDCANNYELILWLLSTDWLCRQIDRYAWFKHVLYESQNVWRYLLSSLCKIQTLGGKFELCLQSETRFNIYSGWVIIHEAFNNNFLDPKNWFAKTWTTLVCQIDV